MPKLMVKVETVTPMFLAGAANQAPELRPASFRGALRFWLRALLGASFGADEGNLRSAESAVFGSTNGASPVVLRTSARVPRSNRLRIAEERLVVPHSKTFSKKAWAEDGQFTLTLATRARSSELASEAIAALLLFLNLGGVGNRSRRGFGSLQAIDAKAEGIEEAAQVIDLLKQAPQNGADVEGHLANVLAWTRSATRTGGGTSYTVASIPNYPVLSDSHAKILVCRHAFAGAHYHEAMINFWDRLRRAPYVDQEEAFGQAVDGRRASPLCLHIAQSQAGHHLVMTAFRSEPEPIGAEGWCLIDKFMQERAAAWDGVFLVGGGVRW